MTVIAFKKEGNKIHVAADTLVTQGFDVVSYTNKIIKHSNDWAVGFAGDASIGQIFLTYSKYYMPGEDKSEGDEPLFHIVNYINGFVSYINNSPMFPTQDQSKEDGYDFVMFYKGHIFTYSSNGELSEINYPFAIGIGQSFAIVAMRLGHTAKEAVEIAIKNNIACGGDIDEFTVITKSRK